MLVIMIFQKNDLMKSYTHIDVSALEELVTLLSPFLDVTAIVSAEKRVTISLIHPMKMKLLDHLNSLKPSSSSVKAARLAILNDFSSRYVNNISHNKCIC